MAEYLLLRLYGPLASWGEIAVGETRRSAVHPSRSALIGLLGAALGIERDDAAGQLSLIRGYRFGVKLECIGSPLRDYHTIASGKRQRNTHYRTRRQELMGTQSDVLLSTREYRCDSLALAAVLATPHAPYSLEQLAEVCRRPHFTLYLGRKSCPLALPLAPTTVTAASLRQAFDETVQVSLLSLLDGDSQQPWPSLQDRRLFRLGQARYYWDEGMESGMAADFDSWRHDQPLSRDRWQFAARREWVALDEGSAA